MRTSVLVVATAIVFALIGFKGTQLNATKKPHDSQQCKNDDCKVVVMIDAAAYCYGGTRCDIYVDHELTETQGHHLNFELDSVWTPRFEFPDDGIVFTPTPGSPADGFSCGKVTGKNTIRCTNNKPKDFGIYKYTIKLRNISDKSDLTLDPWVVNK